MNVENLIKILFVKFSQYFLTKFEIFKWLYVSAGGTFILSVNFLYARKCEMLEEIAGTCGDASQRLK